MTAQIIPFKHEAHEIRVVADDQGQPWFVAADICDILGYANSRQAIAKNCRQAGVSKRDISSGGQMREVTVIDEGNVYRLILKSRKPEAEKFEAWVCDEVLPSLRKTGTYTVPDTINPAQQLQLRRAVAKIARKPEQFKAAYSKLHDQFQISEYKQLPAEQFNAALDFIAGLDGEYLPKQELPNALHELPNTEEILKAAIIEHMGHLRFLCSLDENMKFGVTVVPQNCVVFAPEEWPKLIKDYPLKRDIIPKIIEEAVRKLS